MPAPLLPQQGLRQAPFADSSGRPGQVRPVKANAAVAPPRPVTTTYTPSEVIDARSPSLGRIVEMDTNQAGPAKVAKIRHNIALKTMEDLTDATSELERLMEQLPDFLTDQTSEPNEDAAARKARRAAKRAVKTGPTSTVASTQTSQPQSDLEDYRQTLERIWDQSAESSPEVIEQEPVVNKPLKPAPRALQPAKPKTGKRSKATASTVASDLQLEPLTASKQSRHITSASSASSAPTHLSSPQHTQALPSSLQASLAAERQAHQVSHATAGTSGTAVDTPLVSTGRARSSARARNYTRRITSATATAVSAEGKPGAALSRDSVTAFLTNSTDALTFEDEVATMKLAQDSIYIERVSEQLTKVLGRAPYDEEMAQALNIPDLMQFRIRKKRGEDAKNRMLRANYKLVVKVAQTYKDVQNVAITDLVTWGMQGLARSLEKFDITKGFKFSTFAHWWIRQAITRTLMEQQRQVRVPVHFSEQLSKLAATKKQLAGELGREPTLKELSARMSMSIERILELEASNNVNTTSLDAPLGSDSEGGELHEMFAAENDNPEEALRSAACGSDLDEILSGLTEREAQLVKWRYGVGTGEELTLEEVGVRMQIHSSDKDASAYRASKHFGAQVTRERVRQLEIKAINKLRRRPGVMEKLLEYANSAEDHELAAPSSAIYTKSKS